MSNLLLPTNSRVTAWHRSALCVLTVLATATVTLACKPPAEPRVQVTPNEVARRVDGTVNGKPFTSCVWPERLTKPVLYPIRSAKGALVGASLDCP